MKNNFRRQSRRNVSRSSGSGGLNNPSWVQVIRPERLRGKGLLLGGSATAYSFSLTPTLFSRSTTIADTYNLYRFTRIKFTMMPPPAGTSGDMVSVGFYDSLTDTVPATLVANAECPYTMYTQTNSGAAGITVPVSMEVPRKFLVAMNSNKWWKTKTSASVESWEEVQGTVNVIIDAATVTESFIEVEYVVEFSDPINIGSTPKMSSRIIDDRDSSDIHTVGRVVHTPSCKKYKS